LAPSLPWCASLRAGITSVLKLPPDSRTPKYESMRLSLGDFSPSFDLASSSAHSSAHWAPLLFLWITLLKYGLSSAGRMLRPTAESPGDGGEILEDEDDDLLRLGYTLMNQARPGGVYAAPEVATASGDEEDGEENGDYFSDEEVEADEADEDTEETCKDGEELETWRLEWGLASTPKAPPVSAPTRAQDSHFSTTKALERMQEMAMIAKRGKSETNMLEAREAWAIAAIYKCIFESSFAESAHISGSWALSMWIRENWAALAPPKQREAPPAWIRKALGDIDIFFTELSDGRKFDEVIQEVEARLQAYGFDFEEPDVKRFRPPTGDATLDGLIVRRTASGGWSSDVRTIDYCIRFGGILIPIRISLVNTTNRCSIQEVHNGFDTNICAVACRVLFENGEFTFPYVIGGTAQGGPHLQEAAIKADVVNLRARYLKHMWGSRVEKYELRDFFFLGTNPQEPARGVAAPVESNNDDWTFKCAIIGSTQKSEVVKNWAKLTEVVPVLIQASTFDAAVDNPYFKRVIQTNNRGAQWAAEEWAEEDARSNEDGKSPNESLINSYLGVVESRDNFITEVIPALREAHQGRDGAKLLDLRRKMRVLELNKVDSNKPLIYVVVAHVSDQGFLKDETSHLQGPDGDRHPETTGPPPIHDHRVHLAGTWRRWRVGA
jgi:hypothetical protein